MTDQVNGQKAGAASERSLGQLVASATEDLSTLVRGEIELAKIELKQTAIQAAAGSVMFIVAATFAFLALIMLLFALALGFIALGVWPWVAFILVAVILVAAGAVLAYFGRSKVSSLGPPQHTIDAGKATFQRL